MVGPSVHDGDDVHRMHELDRDAPPAGGAPAIAPLLADVTVPEEETHIFAERRALRGPVASLRQDSLQFCARELRHSAPTRSLARASPLLRKKTDPHPTRTSAACERDARDSWLAPDLARPHAHERLSVP